MSRHDTMAPEKLAPTVTITTQRVIRTIEKLGTEEDRARVVGALASLYLPTHGIRREA